MHEPGSGHLANYAFAFIFIAALLGCEAVSNNPYTIEGQLYLQAYPDGGRSAFVLATIGRPLDDGGSEQVFDAGVSLNQVPLGAPDPQEGTTTVIAGTPPPMPSKWTRDSFSGAGPLLPQTLSVIGANPPAEVGFSCPPDVVFIAPAENSIVALGAPTTFSWSAGGSPERDELFSFFASIPGPGTGAFDSSFGFALVDAGTTSLDFAFPSDIPAGTRASVDISVMGDAPDGFSTCTVQPYLDVQLGNP